MNRRIKFAPGEYYHTYNRGVDKRAIFLDESDYRRFINLLFFCNGLARVDMRALYRHLDKGLTFADFLKEREETLVDIGSYCLMPNHFHLLLHEKVENGLTLFLTKLSTAYSMYFNTKNKRTGSLFERNFLAEHADHDQYLKYLFSYIHLNPAKIIDPEWKENGVSDLLKTKDFVENYKFSSYRNYLGDKQDREILSYSAFPDYFSERGPDQDINEWLGYGEFTKVRPL
jgi:putative transposase